MKPYGIEINAIAPGFVVTKMHEETISAGSDASGSDYLERTRAEIAKGGVPPSVPAECASFFLSDLANGVTGRFIAAVYDNWRELPRRLEELNASDVFTLRRIVGKDRGLNI
jgi:NAD(P)-dependent dehydrogenase (short-subunit alcohol dehydrogenase family)